MSALEYQTRQSDGFDRQSDNGKALNIGAMPALQLSHEYTDEAKGHGTIQEVHIPRYWNMSDDEASTCVVERFDVVPVGMCLSERYQEFRVCDPARFARLETRVNPIDVKIVYGYES